ncbi:hypothetical protein PPERSA_02859 [Pseudocohnilembus persalinus]|uniref:Uncharacterized protein n=1 Tax=Pseudocohnilembus persalinus TaxID=266149 RepID=A0A0V0QN46_PSEPJ|nr:hypothetical protein PPERSA_02859 [Pseudocohnilembus persalinus]|eukprot:KRX03480.1 hypothetical protein PPERSA_02859 [Pseudocohnilembus persalinus]
MKALPHLYNRIFFSPAQRYQVQASDGVLCALMVILMYFDGVRNLNHQLINFIFIYILPICCFSSSKIGDHCVFHVELCRMLGKEIQSHGWIVQVKQSAYNIIR